MDDKGGIAEAYRNLAVIYATQGDLDRAEETQLKSLALAVALDHKEGMAGCYCNLGVIAQKRGNLDGATELQLRALGLYEALDRKEGMAITYGNLTRIYQERNHTQCMCDSGRRERDLWRKMGLEHKVTKIEQWLRANGCDT